MEIKEISYQDRLQNMVSKFNYFCEGLLKRVS